MGVTPCRRTPSTANIQDSHTNFRSGSGQQDSEVYPWNLNQQKSYLDFLRT